MTVGLAFWTTAPVIIELESQPGVVFSSIETPTLENEDICASNTAVSTDVTTRSAMLSTLASLELPVEVCPLLSSRRVHSYQGAESQCV